MKKYKASQETFEDLQRCLAACSTEVYNARMAILKDFLSYWVQSKEVKTVNVGVSYCGMSYYFTYVVLCCGASYFVSILSECVPYINLMVIPGVCILFMYCHLSIKNSAWVPVYFKSVLSLKTKVESK